MQRTAACRKPRRRPSRRPGMGRNGTSTYFMYLSSRGYHGWWIDGEIQPEARRNTRGLAASSSQPPGDQLGLAKKSASGGAGMRRRRWMWQRRRRRNQPVGWGDGATAAGEAGARLVSGGAASLVKKGRDAWVRDWFPLWSRGSEERFRLMDRCACTVQIPSRRSSRESCSPWLEVRRCLRFRDLGRDAN
jgi:hypothetical protein